MARKAFFIFATLLLAGALSVVRAQDDAGSGRAARIFDFPAQHRFQADQPVATEDFGGWLYFTGVLTDDATGDRYGYQFTVFEGKVKQMGGAVLYDVHVAISDVRESAHPFYRYSPFLRGEAAATAEGFDEARGESFWRYTDPHTSLTYYERSDAWVIVTEGETTTGRDPEARIGLNLTLVNDKADYLLQRPGGVIGMGDCTAQDPATMAGMSYYYSHPALTTTGALTLDGRVIHVSGDTWFDHQWGNFQNCFTGWDWFSFRLDDGGYVMLFNFKSRDGGDLPGQRGLTVIDPDGGVQWWLGPEAGTLTPVRWWRSDRYGLHYPVEWVIDTPAGRYAVAPYFDEQT
ncbi:MAG: hypothetical protein HRF48_03150, partial [Chloroflexota bacterium]